MIFRSDIRQDELPPSGIVARTAAERERDIQRYTERKRQEEAILRLEAQLKEQGALKSEARRRRLEKELERAKLGLEQTNHEQPQEGGHLQPNKVQSTIPSYVLMTSSGAGGSCSHLISPLSSPMKKNDSLGENIVLKHVVSPSTVSTAAINEQESSFEDESAEIEGSHCMGGIISDSGRVQQLQHDVNLRKNESLERSDLNDMERIGKLKQRVVNLTENADEFAKQSQLWQEKAIDFTMKFYIFEEEMENKTDVFDDMIRYKQLQIEKIEMLENEVEELVECIVKEDAIGRDEAFQEEEVRLGRISLEDVTATATIRKSQQQKCRLISLKLAEIKGLEGFIYQFTCRECSKGTYMVSAATKESLKQTALEIVEQSARFATNKYARVSDSSTTEQAFVQHLASHVPTTIANNEADALMFCKKIIKAEKMCRRHFNASKA